MYDVKDLIEGGPVLFFFIRKGKSALFGKNNGV